VKEPGLERFLRYDRWPRHAFRVLLFDPARTHADYENLELHEDPGFAGGSYTVKDSDAHDVELFRADTLTLFGKGGEPGPKLLLTKEYSFGPVANGCEVVCEVVVKLEEPLEKPIALGIESIINLLAPAEPDRFFETPAGHENLRFSGTLPAPSLRMEDGWQRVRVLLHALSAKEFWVAPIETVSESEEGFERVYQGSQILAVWHPGLTTQKSWSVRLVWRIETF
jgi:alpha-amylase